MSRIRCLLLAALFIGAPAADRAAAQVLYDPTLGDMLGDQGWLVSPVGVAPTPAADGTVLDTTADMSDYGGFFTDNPVISPAVPLAPHPQAPVLDRQAGFRLSFDLAVVSEDHNTSKDDNADGKHDRAGISVILITSDWQGIELGFFDEDLPNNPNGVWAQDDTLPDDLFTQAEGADVTTAPPGTMVRYHLTVLGDQYELAAETSPGTPLSGPLRNYQAFAGLSFPLSDLGLPVTGTAVVDPYEVPNLIFFGDNTTSAGASVRLGRIEVTPIPEPATCWMLASAAAVLLAWRWRRRAKTPL